MITRSLKEHLIKDLKNKILLVTGPRQCGKTILAKDLGLSFEYFNYDEASHRKNLLKKSWNRKKEYLVFDELHKLKNWKRWLKGIYDTEGIPPGIVVTGSARMDTYKKVGDSLAGRFFQFRLHPFDLKELVSQTKVMSLNKTLDNLMAVGGFPEPFLKAEKRFYGRWKTSHLDIIIRQDIIGLENIKSIISLETLVELLKDRVGSPISYNSLAEDLDCSPKTVKNYLTLLEHSYLIFKVTPWSKNISRSIKKSPKYYFYDIAQVSGEGARFENLVACALLKEIHFRQDVLGEKWDIHYLKNKEKKEVDFFISKNKKGTTLVEVKTSQAGPSSSLIYFANRFSHLKKIQLVYKLKRETSFPNGIEICKAAPWLARMDF